MWSCFEIIISRKAMELSGRERNVDEMENKISFLEREVVILFMFLNNRGGWKEKKMELSHKMKVDSTIP